jgi:catalase
MLQGRLFSYHDTHRHRLGPNYHLLPVNAPKACQADNYQRDGAMRSDGNFGGNPNYYPNSFGGPEPKLENAEPQFDVSGKAGRQKYTHPNDDFVQAGALYKEVMTDADRDHLVGNICGHLGGAQKRIQYRQCAVFTKAHEEYGRRVAEGLKLDPKEVARLAGLSAEDRAKETARGAYEK